MGVVVPETVQIILTGEMPKGILGKDIYFRLLQDLQGRADGHVLGVLWAGVAITAD